MKISNIKYPISKIKYKKKKNVLDIRYLKFDIGYYCLRQAGFTLTELIISISIMVTLLSLVAINLSFAQRRTSLNNTTTAVIADLKQQQTKAMVGDTEGRATADNYGVYFQDNNYVLFHGASYNASDSANRVIDLESSQQFTTINKSILFARVSGEILSYSSASGAITLKDKPSGNTKTIQFNQYGVVTSVN